MLLLLDDDGGEFVRVPEWSLQCALAGAVLMDLALENRIDTDLEQLVLVDPTPVGDDLLDPTLASIAQATEPHDTRYWIQHTAQHADGIRDQVLDRLVERGICGSGTNAFCGCSSRGATRPWTAGPTGKSSCGSWACC